jgi:hypothetical protein
MEPRTLGLIIVALGLALVVVGILVAAGAFGWFGRLPGDLRFEVGGARIYLPITTMVLLSIALTLLLALIRRLQ